MAAKNQFKLKLSKKFIQEVDELVRQGCLPQSIAKRYHISINAFYEMINRGREPNATPLQKEFTLMWEEAEAHLLDYLVGKLEQHKDYRGIEKYLAVRFRSIFDTGNSIAVQGTGNGQITIVFGETPVQDPIPEAEDEDE